MKLRGVEVDVNEILALGYRYLEEEKRKLKSLAKKISPGKSVEEVNKELKKHHPKNYEEALERYREDISSESSFIESHPKPAPPVRSEKLAPFRRCQNCYYCVDTRKLRSSWWCARTHPGRSTESLVAGRMWVKSRLGLVCWTKREADPSEP